MIAPLIVAAIMAAAGALKSEMVDRPAEARKRKQSAEAERWSYFTGKHGDPVKETDTFGTAMQYGMGGMGIGEQMGQADQQNTYFAKRDKLMDQQIAQGTPSVASEGPPMSAYGSMYPRNVQNDPGFNNRFDYMFGNSAPLSQRKY